MKKFTDISCFTKGGISEENNQDYAAITKKYALVIDGATGLLPGNVIKGHDDVVWYVQTIYKNIKPLLDKTLPLKDIVKEALIKSNKTFQSHVKNISLEIYPSAEICLIRINDNSLEYFFMGDCQFAVKYQNNKIKLFRDLTLSKLDNKNIKKMCKLAKRNKINVIDARNLINDDLIATRKLMNTEKGYYNLSKDEKGVDKGNYGVISLDKVSSVLGCTDGFSQIYDTFKLCKLKDIFSQLEKNCTLSDLNSRLREKQEEDSLCNKHPRFKIRDDSTAFYAKIEEE